MAALVSGSVRGHRPEIERDHHLARLARTGALLAGVFLTALVALGYADGASHVPLLWPAAAIAAGLHLTTSARLRPVVLVLIFLLVLLAHVLQGIALDVGVGFSLSCVAAVALSRYLLMQGRDGERAALLEPGDVSRLISTITLSSALAAAGTGLTSWLTESDTGNPWLAVLAAFGAYAAAMMVLLPLFLRTIEFEPLATPAERLTQGVILAVTTVLVFVPPDIPPVFFALMPMFAWYAYRGSLREATVLLAIVGTIGTAVTMGGTGPIVALQRHYPYPPEVIHGVLQLFLLDCGLVLLPLAVMVTQQRMSAGRADSEGAALRQLVASASGTAIIATGRDGTIEVFNPAAEEMFGWTAEEVRGRRPDLLVPAAELVEHAASLDTAVSFEAVCRASVQAGLGPHTWSFVRKDGETRTMRLTLSALSDELGLRRGYLATAEDITEREANQQALLTTLEHQRVAVVRLQELERVKGDFVATVSHELRTPITTIVGYAEVLSDGMVGDLNGDQQEVVDRVERNGRRLLQMVEDLLTISEIESNGIRIDPMGIDFAGVVRQAQKDLDLEMEKRELAVQFDLPERPVVLRGDPVQLRRMVRHLLANAVKFTPDGGEVSVCLDQAQGVTSLVVRDNGIGISETDQDKLFTRFFRSREASEMAIQGTGIGLTIGQSIVATHGGSISVASAVDAGTTITVSLPDEAMVRSA